MTVTRLSILEELASVTDPDRGQTVALDSFAARLEADRAVVEEHLDRLVACELARLEPDRGVRVTVTGQEFLALDTEDLAIVDPGQRDR